MKADFWSDDDELWSIIDPIISAGETYALPTNWNKDEVLKYWSVS
jgi:hypothetical protein